MNDASRRGFLAAAGLGTAAGVAVVAAPGALAATKGADAGPSVPAEASGHLAAYVEDVQSGRLTLMVEGDEVTVTDKALVARLHHAFVTAHVDDRG
jgi:hypothetical protein